MEASNVNVLYICRSINKLANHYFYIIGDYEYHFGKYPKGRIIPKGTTLPYTLIGKKIMCRECFGTFITTYESGIDKKMFFFGYPFVNCESMVCGISFQAIMSVFTLGSVVIAYLKCNIYVALLVFILMGFLYCLIDRWKQSVFIRWTCPCLRGSSEIKETKFTIKTDAESDQH